MIKCSTVVAKTGETLPRKYNTPPSIAVVRIDDILVIELANKALKLNAML